MFFFHLEKKESEYFENKTKKIWIIYILEGFTPIRFSFHSVTVPQMKKKSVGLILSYPINVTVKSRLYKLHSVTSLISLLKVVLVPNIPKNISVLFFIPYICLCEQV